MEGGGGGIDPPFLYLFKILPKLFMHKGRTLTASFEVFLFPLYFYKCIFIMYNIYTITTLLCMTRQLPGFKV